MAALARYKFDGVKIDSCSEWLNMTRWASLMNATGRPPVKIQQSTCTAEAWMLIVAQCLCDRVLTENCHNSDGQDPCPEAKVCPATAVCPYNFWRSSTDINPSWPSIHGNLLTTVAWSGDPPLSRPGRWAFPDMLARQSTLYR